MATTNIFGGCILEAQSFPLSQSTHSDAALWPPTYLPIKVTGFLITVSDTRAFLLSVSSRTHSLCNPQRVSHNLFHTENKQQLTFVQTCSKSWNGHFPLSSLFISPSFSLHQQADFYELYQWAPLPLVSVWLSPMAGTGSIQERTHLLPLLGDPLLNGSCSSLFISPFLFPLFFFFFCRCKTDKRLPAFSCLIMLLHVLHILVNSS